MIMVIKLLMNAIVDITLKVRVIVQEGRIKVCCEFNVLDVDNWTGYFQKLASYIDNDCHTLSRVGCYLKQNDIEELSSLSLRVEYSHLFVNSTDCAKKIFGYDGDNTYIEIKDNTTELSSDGNDYVYFRYTPPVSVTGDFRFQVVSVDNNLTVGYDYDRCISGKTTNLFPNVNNSCGNFTDTTTAIFEAYLESSPLYIGVKVTGKVIIIFDFVPTITLPDENGVVNSSPPFSYQSFFLNTPEIGYLLLRATTNIIKNDINLYYDTPGCTVKNHNYTKLPRDGNYCMKSIPADRKAVLAVQSEVANTTHSIAFDIELQDTVEFRYEFDYISELVLNNDYIFDFENTHAKPFQVIGLKGVNTIRANVTETGNLCNIYIDYSGCSQRTMTTLPNDNYNCREGKQTSDGVCSIEFSLDQEMIIYFGIDSKDYDELLISLSHKDEQQKMLYFE
jgi:hypothetical protein